MSRRKFLKNITCFTAGSLIAKPFFAIPPSFSIEARPLKFGLITDLHHLQFGQIEDKRMTGFMDSVLQHNPDFIVQCGDFCRPEKSDEIMRQWHRFKGSKHHVLGNHDMDVCSKQKIMELWEMKARYYSFDMSGYHFVIMDRNFLKDDSGKLIDYNTSNWSKLSAEYRSFTDQEQLEWLREDLKNSKYPVIVFMHQPVFISDFFKEIGNADEILNIFDEANYHAQQLKKNNKVSAVFMGHDHDDRYGERNGVHYFIVNSASYVYTKGGAYFYKDPLYAFVTLNPNGEMTIEGKSTTYLKDAPDYVQMRFPTRISNYKVMF